MTGKILFVAGLPGCGKSTHLKKLADAGWRTFDDFKAEASNNDPAFHKSRHFEALVTAIARGERCVVADVDFCRAGSRREAEWVIEQVCPGAMITWDFFANDPSKCAVNIRRRNRESIVRDLECLDELASKYQIPFAVAVLPVLGADRVPLAD